VTTSYANLLSSLAHCRELSQEKDLTLGEVFENLQESSYSLICIVLCLPFLQPLSLGPISTLGSLTFVALGWQLAVGRHTPWLPERILRIAISHRVWTKLFQLCGWILRICGRFSRPRMSGLLGGRHEDRLIGSLIVVGGALMALPLPGIPFNNTFPAIMILFACIAELEDDGVFVILSLVMMVVSICYFALLIYVALFMGSHALDWLGIDLSSWLTPAANN